MQNAMGGSQRAVCMFCNSTWENGRVEARCVQGCTLCKHTSAHKSKTLLVDFCKNFFISIFPFSYICCVINRREEQASVGPLPNADPAPFVLVFFLLYSHCKRLFIEFTTEKIFLKKEKSLTQAEFSCYQLIALFIFFFSFYKDLWAVFVANPREQKYIYLYIYIAIHSYSIYIF